LEVLYFYTLESGLQRRLKTAVDFIGDLLLFKGEVFLELVRLTKLEETYFLLSSGLSLNQEPRSKLSETEAARASWVLLGSFLSRVKLLVFSCIVCIWLI